MRSSVSPYLILFISSQRCLSSSSSTPTTQGTVGDALTGFSSSGTQPMLGRVPSLRNDEMAENGTHFAKEEEEAKNKSDHLRAADDLRAAPTEEVQQIQMECTSIILHLTLFNIPIPYSQLLSNCRMYSTAYLFRFMYQNSESFLSPKESCLSNIPVYPLT